MTKIKPTAALWLGCAAWAATAAMTRPAAAQDWPQWRGANGDARAADFQAPTSWPKELPAKWKTAVGEGTATPALVGDKLYAFGREGGDEVARCLDAASGNELWREKYPSQGATGPAAGFSGPRASPAVADGKVVTLGVRGVLSCLDAATGKKLWRKDDFDGATPRFQTASSPLIAKNLVIAQLGGQGNGGIVAYDLATGNPKWKWTGDGPDYASPALMTVDGTTLVVAETAKSVVALTAADGKLAWETPFAPQGMGAYNAVGPVVDGDVLIYSGNGRGTHAVRVSKSGTKFAAKPLWTNADKAVQFCSPVVKDGLLYGMTAQNELFCLETKTGKTQWTQAMPGGAIPGGGGGPGGGGPGGGRPSGDRQGGDRAGGDRPGGDRPGGPGAGPGGGQGGPGGMARRGGRGGGGGGGGGRGGYGTIVDAGSVLFALTPGSELVVFKPGGDKYAEVAKIKVAATPTYAYPVASGKRLFVKDLESVSMLTVE